MERSRRPRRANAARATVLLVLGDDDKRRPPTCPCWSRSSGVDVVPQTAARHATWRERSARKSFTAGGRGASRAPGATRCRRSSASSTPIRTRSAAAQAPRTSTFDGTTWCRAPVDSTRDARSLGDDTLRSSSSHDASRASSVLRPANARVENVMRPTRKSLSPPARMYDHVVTLVLADGEKTSFRRSSKSRSREPTSPIAAPCARSRPPPPMMPVVADSTCSTRARRPEDARAPPRARRAARRRVPPLHAKEAPERSEISCRASSAQ